MYQCKLHFVLLTMILTPACVHQDTQKTHMVHILCLTLVGHKTATSAAPSQRCEAVLEVTEVLNHQYERTCVCLFHLMTLINYN